MLQNDTEICIVTITQVAMPDTMFSVGIKNQSSGASLVVQRLRLCTPSAGDPGQGIKPQAKMKTGAPVWHNQGPVKPNK